MAIIYSYPVDATPATGDLLLGTSIAEGNATKSYTIASLVGLVNTQGGTGTVRTVNTSNSTFINVQGGPIVQTGTLTASLSASGTPSNTTFLRGDNTWSPASTTGSPTIEVFDEGVSLTSAVNSFNFIGPGVTATAVGNAVTVNVPTASNAITSINGGTAISVDQTTGDVTVTNIGVTSLIAGTNITLSGSTGSVTINATNNPGTVQSILPGNGLKLDSGSLTTNPTIGVDYTGSNNYILIGESAATITSDDFIAFNQLSSSNVKTTTMSTVPMAALPLVKSYIDTGDASVVKNNTDTFTSTATINDIVTLTSTEYSGITPATNTLYIIATGSTTYTVTLNPVTNSIVDATAGAPNYTITGNVQGDTVTGIAGEPYTFTTVVTPNAGYYFSTPVSGNIISGTIASTTTVAQTLTGTLVAVPSPTVTATLLVVTDIQGGPSDGSGFVLGGSLTGATQAGTAPLTVNTFATTCTAATGYTFSAGPVITNASGTINGSQTVVTTITGTLQLT